MSTIPSFGYTVPQDIRFGFGALTQLPAMLSSAHQQVMLISDHGLEKVGTVGKVQQLLAESGIVCHAFLDVIANPTTDVVSAAVEAFNATGSTAIIALGGGSPMDVAKAVAVVAKFGGKIKDYDGAHKVPGAIVPIYAIPTTAGTGSESTAFSVITDPEVNYKFTVFSYELLPQYVLLDPEMIMSLPMGVAAATGVDAMIHALEAYISRNATPFSDAMAEKALELIGGNIRKFVACREDTDAAGAMMLGSHFAGIAFSWARLGNVHAMSHPVSAFYHVAHGVANSILLPTILEYNALADTGKYKKLYNYISRTEAPSDFVPMMLVDEIKALLTDFGIPLHLREVGVTEEHLGQMVADAMKSGNILANPRQSNAADIKKLYLAAM